MRPPTPFVPGTEAAGVVVSVGSNVTRFKPGDRAACLNWIGGFGERMVAKEWKSVRIPDAVSFESAATVIHSYDTAYYALVLRAQLRAGETVVVTGAGGGVGMAAVDVARHLGGRVIAAVGSDRHAAALREHGVSEIVNYSAEKLRDRLKELTNGRGIDVCFDNVGGSMFEELARSMSWGGRLLPIGFTSGVVTQAANESAALEKFFDHRGFRRCLGRQGARCCQAGQGDTNGMGRRRPDPTTCRPGPSIGAHRRGYGSDRRENLFWSRGNEG